MATSLGIQPVGAIVLAAGFSKRFGGIKQLASLNSEHTLLTQTLDNISKVISDIVVVTRPEIASQLDGRLEKICIFHESDKGMGASLAFGISQTQGWSAALICLADMPFIKSQTYATLAQASNYSAIVVPTFGGKQANPVAFGAKHFTQLAALEGAQGGKSVLQNNLNDLVKIEINDPGLVQDIDTVDDLQAYQS